MSANKHLLQSGAGLLGPVNERESELAASEMMLSECVEASFAYGTDGVHLD